MATPFTRPSRALVLLAALALLGSIAVVAAPEAAADEPPIAVDDGPWYVVLGETRTVGNVLANDVDPEGAPLTAVKVTDPAHGSLTLNPDGTVTYAHNGGTAAVTDSFTYSASDGTLLSEPATVTLSILGGRADDGGVAGTITSDGVPASGICVMMGTRAPDGAFDLAGETETTADGSYVMEVVPSGYEWFAYDCTAGVLEYEYYDDASSYEQALTVNAEPGNLQTVDADLRAGWSITGTVTAEHTGEPLAGIEVTAGTGSFGVIVSIDRTGPDGTYALTGLRRNVAYTILFDDLTGAYESEYFDDEYQFQAADPVRAASETVTGVDAALLPMLEWYDLGLVDPASGLWYLTDVLADRPPVSFYYGNPGDFPMVGDWDCDGLETPGLYRRSDGYVYLRNSNTVGVADVRFFFGDPGDLPLAGDFDGDDCDTVSIYRPDEGRVFIINELGSGDTGLGAAEHSYYFGNPGDKPFVGDFDGDGIETVGLHRESTGLVYFNNEHRSKAADNEFIFGDPGDRLVAGDWNLDGLDSPAVFRPGNTMFYLRFTNTAGVADESFEWGESGWLPVAGVFWPDSTVQASALPAAPIGRPMEVARGR